MASLGGVFWKVILSGVRMRSLLLPRAGPSKTSAGGGKLRTSGRGLGREPLACEIGLERCRPKARHRGDLMAVEPLRWDEIVERSPAACRLERCEILTAVPQRV